MHGPTLQQFFRHQAGLALDAHGLKDPPLVSYIGDLLTRFASTTALWPWHDEAGRPIDRLAEMGGLLSRDTDGVGATATRQREVLRHVADYALFMSGLFRERLQHRGELEYYLTSGGAAYGRCARYESIPERTLLYRKMHARFGEISDTLDHMRRERLPMEQPASVIDALWRH